MDRIAFIFEDFCLYWSSIILILAAAAAICIFLCLYLRQRGNGLSAAILVPLASVMGLLLARLAHWYCRADAYASLNAAMTEFTGGGYALMGVFAGCILAVVLLRLLRIVKNAPMAFDCLAVAGAAGVCLGRLASLYTSADRGMVMEGIKTLPLVYPVSNSVTGVTEYRLATFMLQAIVAGALFLVLLVMYLRPRKEGKQLKDGDTAMLFLLVYGSSQVLLDSTRYDSLFMRSNGFISIVQILGAVSLALVIVMFSIRLVKARGFKWWYVALWLVLAGCIGGAAFMEYYVQRHGDLALFCYSVMGACLTAAVVLTCAIRLLAVSRERKNILVETNNE